MAGKPRPGRCQKPVVKGKIRNLFDLSTGAEPKGQILKVLCQVCIHFDWIYLGNLRTNNLQDYFEKHYRQGGEFEHPEYKEVYDEELYVWVHEPTGIQVWRDAIDLTVDQLGEVYFHYTSELGFRNITHPSKEAAEVYASLNTDNGPKQNAWWGKGVYSVPLSPDQLENREQLLDNNFRNMMKRDREDSNRGQEYVNAEYPKRAAFCVPILIDPSKAFDISKRATPEMEAAGKEPGRNLGDKLLNEPGMPPRCCVVLRVDGEAGAAWIAVNVQHMRVEHARARLLNTLETRADAAEGPFAKWRLGDVLRRRGKYREALPMLRQVLEDCKSEYGPKKQETLNVMNDLANLLMDMGRYREAAELHRQALLVKEEMLPTEDPSTLQSMNNLGVAVQYLHNYTEAMQLLRRALDARERTLGPDHPHTVESINNLAALLEEMGNEREALALQRRCKDAMERTLGAEHPDTLVIVSNLATLLDSMGECSEAAALLEKTLGVNEKTLGPKHPHTVMNMGNLAVTLQKMGKHHEAEKLLNRRQEALRSPRTDDT